MFKTPISLCSPPLNYVLPWQMNSTFICSFISSQILSNARKYWVCGVFFVFSFVLKSRHISSIVWHKNWHKTLKAGMFWHKNCKFHSNLGITFHEAKPHKPL